MKVFTFLFAILVWFHLSGCSDKNEIKDYYTELNLLLKDNSKPYKIDSLKIDLYDNHIYKLSAKISIENIDSGLRGDFVYIPILASSSKLKFLQEISSDKDSLLPEVLKVEARSGNNYYLLAFSGDSIIENTDSVLPFQLSYTCLLSNKEAEKYANVPVGTIAKTSVVQVTTDWSRKLKSNNLVTYSSKASSDDQNLFEYPKDLISSRRTYLINSQDDSNAILQLDCSTQTVFPSYYKYIGISIMALIYILFGFVMLKQFQIRNYKKYIAKVKEYANQEKYKSYFDDFYKEDENPDIPSANSFLSKGKFQIQFTCIIIVVLITLFLFFSLDSFSQVGTNHPVKKSKNIIDNLNLTISPEFDKQHVDCKAHCVFAIASPKKLKRDTVDLNVLGKQLSFDTEKKIAKPDGDVVIDESPFNNLYNIKVSSSHRRFISEARLKLIVKSALKERDNQSVAFQKKSLSSEKSTDTVNLITELPFKDINYKKPDNYTNVWGFKIYYFPYDRYTLEVPLNFEQPTLISNLIVNPVKGYKNEVYTNKYEFQVSEENGVFASDDENSILLKPDENFVLTFNLSRSLTLKWLLPIVMIICTFYSYLWDEKKNTIFISLGFTAGITAIYGLIIKAYPDIPSFLNLDDSASIYDLLVAVLFLIQLAIQTIRKL